MMRVWRLLIGAAALSALAACDDDTQTKQTSTSEQDQATVAADAIPHGQLGDSVVPTHYQLDLTILPTKDSFSGAVAIDVAINEPSPILWVHGNDLDVSDVWLTVGDQRIDASYEQVDPTGIARISLDSTPPKGPATLSFQYTAPFNGALEGLYKVTEGGEDYAFTQFEATSARLAFPSFDEPAFKTPFDISVTAKATDTVITATPEVSQTDAGDGLVTRHYETTPPLPTYLIAFAVGPLDVVDFGDLPPNEVRDRPLPLRGVAAKGKGDQLGYALENTQAIIEAQERYFNVAFPYPKLDIIAVPDFAAGAMENVGAITYREQLLLLGDGSQVSEGQKRAYASVHSHELAHQWFGNLVTPKWWDDIWLNESFATWMGNKSVDMAFPGRGFSTATFRGALGVMGSDSLATARQIREPIRSNHDIATAFDGITYRKGGGVLAMFEAFLGEDAFREGVRLHMERFANDVADVNDFMQSLADGANRPDVVDAFRSFLFQPGVPIVRAELSCDGDAIPRVTLNQSRYFPVGSEGDRDQTWKIPVCMAYGTAEGRDRFCTVLSEAEATIELPSQSCPAWLMPNDNGSGYYRMALDEQGWSALFSNFDALNEREAQALLGSLSAAYRSDDASTATMVDAFGILAKADNREVATQPVSDLGLMYGRLAQSEAAKDGISALVRDLYGDRLQSLGLEAAAGETGETHLLRGSLVSAMANLGKDEALRATLVERAKAYLGDGEELDNSALDAGIVGTALAVAVEEEDFNFAQTLLDRALASRDATFRQRALGALATSPADDVASLMRSVIGDERVRDNEAILIAFSQVGVSEQREAMWEWVQGNLDVLLPRIPTWRKGAIANMGSGFCSVERAEEVNAFFADKVDDLEGGPRELAQTLERIRLCAALVDAKAEQVTSYFSAR
ncbi:aminopeptidase [Iodidimonas muriae]|uniref:Aminopeptidase n=1 Tax=Iodidimonas muriae TaxID=261467 RepID=A0ABQ2L8J8_9PROT|nr:M1 family metallopeptidase [Iodidimonas muriae]GER05795.1 aminopeptidase [Kordiimonadales bacterium JCM 17843]GGO06914.1 aminopeptidase [Iodidimonas muriae]